MDIALRHLGMLLAPNAPTSKSVPRVRKFTMGPTSNIFYRFRQYSSQSLVRKFAIGSSLQFGKWPFLWVRIQATFPLAEALQKFLEGHFICRFSKQFLVEILSPEIVLLTDARMPAIRKIELGGDRISNAAWLEERAGSVIHVVKTLGSEIFTIDSFGTFPNAAKRVRGDSISHHIPCHRD